MQIEIDRLRFENGVLGRTAHDIAVMVTQSLCWCPVANEELENNGKSHFYIVGQTRIIRGSGTTKTTSSYRRYLYRSTKVVVVQGIGFFIYYNTGRNE
jgi:hypothetical protein